MTVLRVILFTWLAISLSVYAFRLVRWISRRGDASMGPEPVAEAGVLAPTGRRADILVGPARSHTSRRARRKAQIEAMQAEALGPMPTEKLFREIADERRAAALDQATPDGPSDALAPLPYPRPIATLVAGLGWPCGLAPHIVEGWDPQSHVAFVTTSASGAEVEAQLRDRLTSLGYTLVESGGLVIADGSQGRFAMAVYDGSSDAAAGFGALARNAVVVELTTRW